MKKTVIFLFIFSLLTSLTGCGTVLYPERIGQRNGHLDSRIVILDGLGLILGVVPGVVAFIIDFANGTIYLPKGQQATLNNDELKAIATLDGKINIKILSDIMQKKLPNKAINSQKLIVSKLSSTQQLPF